VASRLSLALLLGLVLVPAGCASGVGDKPVPQAESQRLEPLWLLSLGEAVQESSGLAAVAQRYWTLNDSGGAAQLIWVDPLERSQGNLALEGAVNFDWEALAQSETSMYIVDCGNNRGDRIWLQLYTLPLTALNSEAAIVQRQDFRWGDVDYQINRRAHDNDCEAAAWVDDQLWLFTKGWESGTTRLYTLRPGEDRQSLLSKAEYPVDGLITGADYSATHQRLALIGYGKGLRVLQPFIWIVPVKDKQMLWDRAKRYWLAQSGQWEALVWDGDSLVISREESVLGGAGFARISLPAAALKDE